MYKAAAIERINNLYVEIPYDCVASSTQLLAIKKVDYMAGGLARVLLKGTGDYLYTTDHSIIE